MSTPLTQHGVWSTLPFLFIILADDVVRRRGYDDHFVRICMWGWICILAW